MDAMINVRKKIADDKAKLPGLHERAIELHLHPQPWWSVDFYEYAIKNREDELDQSK